MAAGEFLKPLFQTWEILKSPKLLADCGFVTSLVAASKLGAELDRENLAEEEELWAEWVLLLLVSLTRLRYRHLLFYTHGPGLLAGLLSEEQGVVEATLQRLRTFWTAWQGTATLAHSGLLDVRKRCWIGRPMILKFHGVIVLQ